MCRYGYKNRKTAVKPHGRTSRFGFLRGLKNIPVMSIVMGIGMIVMGVIYLKTVNGISTTGYEMASLQADIQALKLQNEKLSVETSTFNSLERVSLVSAARGLVEAQEVEYLSDVGTVAVAR